MRVKPATARKKRAAKAPKTSLRDEFRTFARAAILSAAEEVFANEGLHEARIEVIAERARVAVGTIYNLVGDREALVGEIIGARQLEVVALMKQTLAETAKQPFDEQLEAFIGAVFSYMREHRHFFRMVVAADHATAKAALRAKGSTLSGIRDAYRDLIARGIRQRALSASGRELYPVVLLGMVREVLFLDLEDNEAISPKQRAKQLVELFLQGAGTR